AGSNTGALLLRTAHTSTALVPTTSRQGWVLWTEGASVARTAARCSGDIPPIGWCWTCARARSVTPPMAAGRRASRQGPKTPVRRYEWTSELEDHPSRNPTGEHVVDALVDLVDLADDRDHLGTTLSV